MPYRLTKIYTRKGDAGLTTLGGKPISKDDVLIDVVGTLDELNASIGMIIALKTTYSPDIDTILTRIQNDLFDFGGELHLPDHVAITPEKVTYLEEQLDNWNGKLPPLREFLLPRGNPASAACHVARTVCRRAERCLVKFHRQIHLKNQDMIRYLNRLSDFLFVCARILARETEKEEKMWERDN